MIRERENSGRGGGAIIRGRRLIEGRLLFEEIRYFSWKRKNVFSPVSPSSVESWQSNMARTSCTGYGLQFNTADRMPGGR